MPFGNPFNAPAGLVGGSGLLLIALLGCEEPLHVPPRMFRPTDAGTSTATAVNGDPCMADEECESDQGGRADDRDGQRCGHADSSPVSVLPTVRAAKHCHNDSALCSCKTFMSWHWHGFTRSPMVHDAHARWTCS